MSTDEKIVAQAGRFVNALRSGKQAHVPALRFGQWEQFMAAVNAETGYSRAVYAGAGASVYPALGLA